jgi:hypothetical protein
MDNYFTSVALFQKLYEDGYGACGTARPGGMSPVFKQLKENGKAFPWGTLHAQPVKDVLCLAWQDNNMVLALSTLHTPTDLTERVRKRPAKTSTNGSLVQQVFREETQKKLSIPVFIDDYNHHMNGVDLANQFRASYEVHRTGYRNWLPLLYFFIDAAVVNAYRMHCIHKQQHGNASSFTQLSFREKLYQQLFALSSTDLPSQRLDTSQNHVRVSLKTRQTCVWCQYKRKQGQQEGTRVNRARTGCKVCDNVALCKTGCWQEFHSIKQL